jgi:hypothetical protein
VRASALGFGAGIRMGIVAVLHRGSAGTAARQSRGAGRGWGEGLSNAPTCLCSAMQRQQGLSSCWWSKGEVLPIPGTAATCDSQREG